MVAPVEKSSLLGSQFDSKQCREQFFTFVLFPSVLVQFFDLPISILVRLLLDFDTNRGDDPLGVFPLFQKKVADIIALQLSIIWLKLNRLDTFGVLEVC